LEGRAFFIFENISGGGFKGDGIAYIYVYIGETYQNNGGKYRKSLYSTVLEGAFIRAKKLLILAHFLQKNCR